MADYDFTNCLSSIDFELLSKDILEAELGVQLENFSEGRDKGIDLRYAPIRQTSGNKSISFSKQVSAKPPELIVQCKRYSKFSDLKSTLKNKEIPKIVKLKPDRYILTTSVSLSPSQVDELHGLLTPFVKSTGDIYGRDRLNAILSKHEEIVRRHLKLWVESTGVLNAILNAGTHIVSKEEVERTIAASKIYVRNESFDEALAILKQHHVCIIAGLPGIGKTTLARMLMLYFYDKKFDVVKIESDISEARSVGFHKNPRFYLYDDFLGQTGQADKLGKNEDQKLLDFMASIRDSKSSVFVLTTREYILNQAKLHYEKLDREKFDHRTCVVDLSKYSRRIRAQILYNHLHFSDLPRTHLTAVLIDRGYLKIVDHPNYNPRLIEFLTSAAWVGNTPPEGYVALFIRNLDNPTEIWGHAFRNQISDSARHLLFVLTTMPLDSRMNDVEKAFDAFHSEQRARFGSRQSSSDFKSALKELDSTFIASSKAQDTIFLKFQNPSIRDYMQNLLLGGELLPEIIDATIFFEQAQWFARNLANKTPQIPSGELLRHHARIVIALRRLIEASGCSFLISGRPGIEKRWPIGSNLVERLVVVAQAYTDKSQLVNDDWFSQRLVDLSERIVAGRVSVDQCVDSIQSLKTFGCLETAAGGNLVEVVKRVALRGPRNLDDFETLATLRETFSELFSEEDIASIRGALAEAADRCASEIGEFSPDELRDKAHRIESLGEEFDVYTDSAQDRLRTSADEIEQEQGASPDDDDEYRGRGYSDACSDAELNSMFGTLTE